MFLTKNDVFKYWLCLLCFISTLFYACQNKVHKQDYTQDFAYILNHIDQAHYSTANNYLDSIDQLLMPLAVDRQKAKVLHFMIDYRQEKAVDRYSYIVDAYDFFERAKESEPLFYSLAGYYAATYYKAKGMDAAYTKCLRLVADFSLAHKGYLLSLKAYYSLGNYYHGHGSYSKALSAYIKAQTCARLGYFHQWHAKVLTAIGKLYVAQRQLDSALEYYNIAYRLAQQSQDSNQYAPILQNMGVAYKELEQYSKAIADCQQALQYAYSQETEGNICVNIADIYMQWREMDSAWYYLQKAKPLVQNTSGIYLLNCYYSTLCRYYIIEGKTDRALQNFSHFTSCYDSIMRLQNKVDTDNSHALAKANRHTPPSSIGLFVGCLLLLGTACGIGLWRQHTSYKKRQARLLSQKWLYHALQASSEELGLLITNWLESVQQLRTRKNFNAIKKMNELQQDTERLHKEHHKNICIAAKAYLQEHNAHWQTCLSDTDCLYLALCHLKVEEKYIYHYCHISNADALRVRIYRIRKKLQDARIPKATIEQWVMTND